MQFRISELCEEVIGAINCLQALRLYLKMTFCMHQGHRIICHFVKSLHFFSVFAMIGMFSPASHGSLMTAVIFLYVFMG